MTAPASTTQIPCGLVCVTTFGPIRHETAHCLMECRSYSENIGLKNVAWQMIPGGLVERARNAAARTMLGAFRDPQGVSHCEWLLQIDGDMTFEAGALQRIVTTAFGECPWADIVGGYCTLKGHPNLPTIDTGSGLWESHFPGKGPVEVIRTGTAFLLVKRRVFEQMPEPWFRVRQPMRFLDAMAEVDNWARMKLDGQNPFRNLKGKPWEKLEQLASSDPSSAPGAFTPAEVGEDSGFCDRAKNMGFKIVVDTNVQVGHLDMSVLNADSHKTAMQKIETEWLLQVGVGS